MALRICPFCEACCGLEVTVDGDRVHRVRGDREDVFSAGYLCPKASALGFLHEDPDRLRGPVVKREDGRFEEVSWAEAFTEADRLISGVVERHGRGAMGAYVGNPNAHNLSGQLYVAPLLRALGTRNIFSASTADQRPKEVACAFMFGAPLSVPVPDLDRTDHVVLLGANPCESNGSMATAADWPGRLAAIVARGGRVVVVDPKRTKTAEIATEHVPIRPGADGFLLMAMVNVLFAEGLVDLGEAAPYVDGVQAVGELSRFFTPEATEAATGIPVATVRRLARELAAAPRACVYGRIGTTTVEFGTLNSWLVDVLNTLTGNLDRPGGAMFAKPAAGSPNTRGAPRFGKPARLGRHHSRVRELPETFGELPVVCLAEEILTPGEGRMRGLITVAGNPVLSAPGGRRLDDALADLEAYVAVDIYVNETTRHADVILPGPSPLQRGHYDLFFGQLAMRNAARYSPPVLTLAPGQPDEWEVLAKLALIVQGHGPDADPATADDAAVAALVRAAVADEHGLVHGRDPAELVDALGARRGPERLLDLMLRTGPYGDGFGARPGGLSLDVVLAHPHGVDLGPLEPRLPDALRTPSGMVELAPEALTADVERLAAALDRRPPDMVMVGRRHLRSNNSWMHNLPNLVKGKARCTLQVHPDDAARLGLAPQAEADVTSRTGTVTVAVEVTDAVRPGVVSLPHGWGHDRPGVRLGVAAQHAGVNSNLLGDEELFDPLSGTAVLNGIPVTVRPAAVPG